MMTSSSILEEGGGGGGGAGHPPPPQTGQGLADATTGTALLQEAGAAAAAPRTRWKKPKRSMTPYVSSDNLCRSRRFCFYCLLHLLFLRRRERGGMSCRPVQFPQACAVMACPPCARVPISLSFSLCVCICLPFGSALPNSNIFPPSLPSFPDR